MTILEDRVNGHAPPPVGVLPPQTAKIEPPTPKPVPRPAVWDVAQLRRLRWAVRATLLLGVAASVAANVLHAQPNIISQTISAWPPLALLLTVELTSRIPMHRRGLAALRVVATVVIAGIAAWVSYWHMSGVAARYGETGSSPYLLPVSVDGLIVVASICLVELAGRIRHHEAQAVERQAQAERDAAAARLDADRKVVARGLAWAGVPVEEIAKTVSTPKRTVERWIADPPKPRREARASDEGIRDAQEELVDLVDKARSIDLSLPDEKPAPKPRNRRNGTSTPSTKG